VISSQYSFPSSNRLSNSEAFAKVFKQSKKLHTPEFSVYLRQNGLESARLGLAVSKKTAKKAVTRNKIKRIIRESFRLRKGQMRGLDIIIVAKPNASLISKAKLFEVTQKIWGRIGKNA